MKISRILGIFKRQLGVLTLAAVLAVGVMGTAITAYAESAGKVTATTAKIRKEPNTASDTIASTESGNTISITGQTTGSDGYTWYQVWVDDTTVGYIRSDLVSITDGSTPATVDSTAATTASDASTGGSTTTSEQDETVVEVTAVNPVSANVSGSSPVRVRQNASTTSRIYATVESGSALTVTGMATGTDGNQWYQVSFTSGGSEVNGFIRADYVQLGGELTEATETTETGTEGETETAQSEETEETVTKDWDTYQSDDGLWHLQDNTSGKVYSITEIFDTVETNTEIANSATAAKKTLQTVVIILVILLVAAVAAVGYLVFRMKDMADSAYYHEVEQETLRRRANKQQENRAASRTGEKRPASGQRQGGDTAARDQRQMPNQQKQDEKTTTTQKQRPVTEENRSDSAQPQETARSDPKQAEPQETGKAAKRSADKRSTQPKDPSWKSKNFAADDDEFEFEFLNWDGDEE